MAILGELPRDPWEVGLHVSAVLGLVAGIIREGWLRAHTSTPPREKVQITTNHQGAPHNWRDCWLRTVATPEIGRDRAHQIQQAIDTVWGDLPASDRRLIHIHTCLHADSTTDEVMQRFLELVTEQAGGGHASPTATE